MHVQTTNDGRPLERKKDMSIKAMPASGTKILIE